VGAVTLDGQQVPYDLARTPRGSQVRVAAGARTDTSTQVVTLR
jgi:hypothetical protein